MFAAVMDISTAKVVLALAATWGVPEKHGDIQNAYVRAEKEAHLDIWLEAPRGMTVFDSTLREVGAANAGEVVLELQRSPYGSSRQDASGASCSLLGSVKSALRDV